MTKEQAEKWFALGAGASTVFGGPLDPIFQAEWDRVGATDDDAQREVDRMRPIVEAACAYERHTTICALAVVAGLLVPVKPHTMIRETTQIALIDVGDGPLFGGAR